MPAGALQLEADVDVATVLELFLFVWVGAELEEVRVGDEVVPVQVEGDGLLGEEARPCGLLEGRFLVKGRFGSVRGEGGFNWKEKKIGAENFMVFFLALCQRQMVWGDCIAKEVRGGRRKKK